MKKRINTKVVRLCLPCKNLILAQIMLLLLMVSSVSWAQSPQTISGTVTDTNGDPIPGATLLIKETNAGTITNIDGAFQLPQVVPGQTLQVSFVGMRMLEITIDDQSQFHLVLEAGDVNLDEIIVVGYGTMKKANLTGSVANISADKLTERPATNSANLLQGRVTGLQVTQPSAEPGRDNPNILIRGRGSFGGSNDPLVLIDGIAGSISNLSPDDIENVTVLKDASSASIYGARAANGVILVTTKKGRKGAPVFSYRGNIAIHSATSLPDFITNSAEYMTMYNEAAARSGIAFRYPQVEIEKYRHATDRAQYPNFNSVDYWFRNATVNNHSLAVAGGSDNHLYNLSLSYLDQEAMLPGYDFKRYNLLLNYENQLTKAIKVGTSVNLTYRDRKEPPFTSSNLALSIYAAGPTYGAYLPDGSGRVASRAYQNEGRNRSPAEYYLMGNQRTQNYDLNAQGFIEVNPIKGLIWTTKFAINYADEFYKMHQQPYEAYVLQERGNDGDYRPFSFGPDILGVTDQYAKAITPTIYSVASYNTKIGEQHDLSFMAGYEQLSYKNQALRARRINSVAPHLDELTAYTTDNQSLFYTHPRLPGLPNPSEWALRSVFGRVNYTLNEKYLFEANMRYDGTSKVSPDYRWGTFPSASAGWILSEEAFLRNNFTWLNNLKLRASYGVLGNQDVGTYLYQDNLAIGGVAYPLTENGLTQGAVINNFRDQSLRWETTAILDLGFDFILFNGLLGGSFDWFDKTTDNILASEPVPMSLGLGAPTVNDGKMRNRGIELELNHQNRIGEVNYNAYFQISTARNELMHIKVPNYGSTIREIGLPYDAHYLYVFEGIFQEEDIDNPDVPLHVLNPNPKPGDLKMKDLDNNGVIDEDDRKVVDGAYPDFLYSFGWNINYKRFNLSAFFQGVEGRKARVTGWGIDPFNQGTPPTTKWRDAWTPENPSNTMPALYVAGYSGVQNYHGSTFFLQDASYLRLKNVMLSYTLPENLSSRLRMKDLTVYLSGDNLLTFTDYEGADPERSGVTGNYAAYPQARIYNFGINVKF